MNLSRSIAKTRLLSLLLLICLSACGGGGSLFYSFPETTVSVSLSAAKTLVGKAVTLTWSSKNTTSCTGQDSVTGGRSTSGTETITPTAAGQFKYTISCDGASGNAKQTATLVVTIPVQRTSYLNFKNNGQGQISLPEYTHAMAYGDFFQDGSISLMMSPVRANPAIPSDINKTGLVYFYKRINNAWVDKTSEILTDAKGCVWPRKAISADFNGDGKPDIFLACHGFDAPPFAGEKQVLFLSQPDGKYKRSLLDFTCYCHGATAGDFKGDGFADIIITDTSGQFQQPMYLRNNKDGTFTPSKSELSAEVGGFSFPDQTIKYAKPIYTVELVDVNGDGNPDLYVAGNEALRSGETEATRPDAWTSRFYINTNNTFTTTPVLLPIDTKLFTNLDVYFDSDVVWMLKTDYVDTQFKLVRFNIKSGTLLEPVLVPNNGIFWIIRDAVKGVVTAG